MTALPDRPNTAVLVIDVQVDVVAKAHNRQEVLDHINSVIAKARAAAIPVIWIQHADEGLPTGTAGWEYVPELERAEGETLIHKNYGDSFEGTSLEEELRRLGVGRLVVTGAQTDACIRSTLHGAIVRGYDATLVSDAHTTDDYTEYGLPPADKVIAHTNSYWSHQSAPGRVGGTISSDQLAFD